ncbi:MAG: pantetheine-phosphate adenylyltransferase [Ruminococcaceae bacterium]|nr:pantetheine-phosphate adenylyltransferase [Oscillospiraceae bacterium]
MSTVLIPGSYDPITLGHLDVISRAAARFDRVVVAVMTNDMKKYVQDARVKTYMFSLAERKELAEVACAHLPNVEVISAGGMLIHLVDSVNADWIIKGVRSAVDFEYEQKHALYNRAHNPRAETLYMPADPAFDGISSTLVREKISRGEALDPFLPGVVIDWLHEHSRC